MLGCGNLVDEVGTKTNDRNEARKLGCPHDSKGDAQGAELRRLEPHLVRPGVVELGNQLKRRSLLGGGSERKLGFWKRRRRGRREGSSHGNVGQLVIRPWDRVSLLHGWMREVLGKISGQVNCQEMSNRCGCAGGDWR